VTPVVEVAAAAEVKTEKSSVGVKKSNGAVERIF
jgi:hypothetical protein